MSTINRVWDTQAGPGFVSWKTPVADQSGGAYPGPGTFGTHTSDYCVESTLVNDQALVLPTQHSLVSPVGTVQALWQFDGDLLDDSSNAISLSHAGTERYSSGIASGTRSGFINGELVTSPQSATSDPIRLTGAMTLECLVFPTQFVSDATSGFVCHFLNSGGGTANNSLYGFRLIQNTNVLDYVHEGAGAVIVNSGVSISPGRWHHLAFTRDSAGTLIRIYVNGHMVHREVVAEAPTDGANSHIQIGQSETPNRRYFGLISSIRITDAEFRPEHILADARAILPSESRP